MLLNSGGGGEMLSDIWSISIPVIATAVASLLMWWIQSATQSGDLAGTILQVTVIAGLTLIISLRLQIVAMLRPSRSWKLARYVDSQWRYQDDASLDIEISDRIAIRQIGSLITGKAVSTETKNAPYGKFSYSLTGVINAEGIIIGEWKNCDKGRNYYGAFIAQASRNGKTLTAKWIGVGATCIHHGDWDWRSDLGDS